MKLTLLSIAFLTSCVHAPKKATTQTELSVCEDRLKVRDTQMKKYERLCIFLSYAKTIYREPRARLNIAEGTRACQYVFGIGK